MKLSQNLFPPTFQPPAKADTINHQLLVQAGFIRQVMAGVYAYNNLGLAVLHKIANIVREEMLALGSQEVLMPALHPSENWQKSGGWDNIDVLFKIKSRTGKNYALGQSHEEIITPLVTETIKSYKALPVSAFQIQWKYRDELRAKSGILRGREFLMKDMYSFHATSEDFEHYYQLVKAAYLKVFARLGLDAKVTRASGGNFTDKISYEYMVLTDAGEDDIWYCQQCDYCINQEIAQATDLCPECGAPLVKGRASEAGNIFDLGQKFSKAFDLTFTDQNNQVHYPHMGCYGIGVSRAMGIIVEKHHDAQGIIWPDNLAPATVHLITLIGQQERGQQIYEELTKRGISVLWDDREDLTPGRKFAAADLVGCPWRVVISSKHGDLLEVKNRRDADIKIIDFEQVLSLVKS